MIPPPRPGPASGHERTNAVGNPTPDRKRPPAARLSLRLLRLAVYCALWPLSRLARPLVCRAAMLEAHSQAGIRSAISIRLTSIFMPSRISHHATRHERSTCTTRGQPESRRDPLRGARAQAAAERREREGFGDRIAPRMSMWNGERTFFPFYCARITCDVPPSSMPSADPSHGPSSSSCANTNAFALE